MKNKYRYSVLLLAEALLWHLRKVSKKVAASVPIFLKKAFQMGGSTYVQKCRTNVQKILKNTHPKRHPTVRLLSYLELTNVFEIAPESYNLLIISFIRLKTIIN